MMISVAMKPMKNVERMCLAFMEKVIRFCNDALACFENDYDFWIAQTFETNPVFVAFQAGSERKLRQWFWFAHFVSSKMTGVDSNGGGLGNSRGSTSERMSVIPLVSVFQLIALSYSKRR